MSTYSSVSVPICSGSVSSTLDPSSGLYVLNCSQPWSLTVGLMVDPTYATQLNLMLETNGVDWEAVGIGFSSCMALFLIGAYFGFFYNTTRKLR